jgi:NADPH2:quinone reductase
MSSAATMRAVVSREAGGPDTLSVDRAPVGEPGPGEVRVQMRACGINYPDVLMIQDLYQFKPQRPFTPGGEVAGVVEAVGDGVTAFSPGDRVIALLGWGGLAEKVVAPVAAVTAMAESMSFDEGAAVLVTYGTSYYALKDRAALRAGETLLVLGAGGGVGLAAVELGKAAGARVIAAASSQEKVDAALAHGADEGVVYTRGPFDKDGSKQLAALFKNACGAAGADVIYDAVGGDYAQPALRAIAWEGRYLVIGFAAGIPEIPLNLALLKGCQIVGVFWASSTQRDPELFAANNRALMDLYEQGKIRPHVSKRYPLEQAGQALADLAERRALGKVVVTVDG